MYRREHRHQLSFEDFFLPFGGKQAASLCVVLKPRPDCSDLRVNRVERLGDIPEAMNHPEFPQ
jgi:hypothetical protein